MKIKTVQIKQFKRFRNELTIKNIPENTKLVVLIGPNGCGKSCVFDGFLTKSRQMSSRGNYALSSNEFADYFGVPSAVQSTWEVADRINIQFHDDVTDTRVWKTAFNIRSPYRNEADFDVSSLQNPGDLTSQQDRFRRIIDPDQSVASNFQNLVWQVLHGVFSSEFDDTKIGDYRKQLFVSLQMVMRELFQSPTLELQDFGGLELGTFRFSKGRVADFHYKNLSGGEKAAFDILLDIFVKRIIYNDSVYCIDEPELHIAASLQGKLLHAMLELLPESCQLWIATHSIGIVRAAYSRMQKQNDVAFINFFDHDFDETVVLEPKPLNRTDWSTVYQETLADLGALVSPERIVLCEGDPKKNKKGFDAKCYNQIFAATHPETLFISVGGCGEVQNSDVLVGLLASISKGISVYKLRDRDCMSSSHRNELVNEEKNLRVLNRRAIEDYLFELSVLETFLKEQDVDTATVRCTLQKLEQAIGKHKTVKNSTKELFRIIQGSTGLPYLGNDVKEFATECLAPALSKTSSIFEELERDIFG